GGPQLATGNGWVGIFQPDPCRCPGGRTGWTSSLKARTAPCITSGGMARVGGPRSAPMSGRAGYWPEHTEGKHPQILGGRKLKWLLRLIFGPRLLFVVLKESPCQVAPKLVLLRYRESPCQVAPKLVLLRYRESPCQVAPKLVLLRYRESQFKMPPRLLRLVYRRSQFELGRNLQHHTHHGRI